MAGGAWREQVENGHRHRVDGETYPGELLQAVDRGQLLGGVDLGDVGAERQTAVGDERAGEHGRLADVGTVRRGVLRTDVVDVGDELAGVQADDVQKGMTIEVDPDQRARDAALVAREAVGIRAVERGWGV